jgi:hypothetical protein
MSYSYIDENGNILTTIHGIPNIDESSNLMQEENEEETQNSAESSPSYTFLNSIFIIGIVLIALLGLAAKSNITDHKSANKLPIFDICTIDGNNTLCPHQKTLINVDADSDGKWPNGLSWIILKNTDSGVTSFSHTETGESAKAKNCKQFSTPMCLNGDYVLFVNSESHLDPKGAPKLSAQKVHVCDKEITTGDVLDIVVDNGKCEIPKIMKGSNSGHLSAKNIPFLTNQANSKSILSTTSQTASDAPIKGQVATTTSSPTLSSTLKPVTPPTTSQTTSDTTTKSPVAAPASSPTISSTLKPVSPPVLKPSSAPTGLPEDKCWVFGLICRNDFLKKTPEPTTAPTIAPSAPTLKPTFSPTKNSTKTDDDSGFFEKLQFWKSWGSTNDKHES